MIELLLIGDELLDGRILNSNEQTLSQKLYHEGFSVSRSTTIGDDMDALKMVLKEVVSRSKFILTTGGLGPTEDDRTTQAIAEAFHTPLDHHPDIYQSIKDYFIKTGRDMPEENAKQARFPKGSIILDNPHGIAPGFALIIHDAWIFSMPGVPKEMIPMLTHHVIPLLHDNFPQPLSTRRIKLYKCLGLGESHLAEKISDIYPLPQGLHLPFQVKFPEIHIRLIGANAPDSSRDAFYRASTKLDDLLQDVCFSHDPDETYAAHVVSHIKSQHKKVAVAESCTGGLLSELITQIPGASDVFEFGVVSYSNQSKMSLLGVPDTLIDTHGVVSEEVAKAMVQGVFNHNKDIDLALSITGIAGPDGGSDEKPVGTVFFGYGNRHDIRFIKRQFSGDRERIRLLSAYVGLGLLKKYSLE